MMTGNGAEHSHNPGNSDSSPLSRSQTRQLIQRLERRVELMGLSRHVRRGIVHANQQFSFDPAVCGYVGEEKAGGEGLCAYENPGPANFVCTPTDFNCGNFECDQSNTFNTQCTDSNSYDCGTDEYFACRMFECARVDPSDSFDCDQKIDFVCGDDFECSGDFDCTAGHVFMCADDHTCEDNFLCKTTANEGCDGDYEYSRKQPNGPNDGDPGDFVCGWTDDTNVFDCDDIFDCQSEDSFGCEWNTTFECGSTSPATNFSCTAKSEFECQNNELFDCKGAVDQFDCARTSPYDCAAGSGKYTSGGGG